jgi:hypothetical protein
VPVDLSEIAAFDTVPGGKCRTGRLLNGGEPGLSAKDRETLRAGLVSPHQSTALAAWLATKGVKIDPQTIGRHRTGKCRCDRP